MPVWFAMRGLENEKPSIPHSIAISHGNLSTKNTKRMVGKEGYFLSHF